MHLDEVLQLFRATTHDDWHSIYDYARFSYHQSFESERQAGSVNAVAAPANHGQYAVCKRDVALSMAWGLDVSQSPYDFTTRDPQHLDWAPSFWGEVHEHYADLFYNNVLVWRFSYLVGDGGRMFLPWAKAKLSGSNPPRCTHYFDRQDIEDVRLIAMIGGADAQELRDRLQMTGLQVADHEDEVSTSQPEPTE